MRPAAMGKQDELENAEANMTVACRSSGSETAPTITAVVVPNISDSALLLRNAGWYLAGNVLPMVAAVIAMPRVIRIFGADRVGILSLGLSILGLQTVLGLGMDRATIKLLAEVRSSTGELGTRFKTSLFLTAVVSLSVTALLAIMTPFLATTVFNVPLDLVGEARAVFLIFSAWLLVELLSSPFAAVLMAMERFAWLTAVRTVSAIGTYCVLLGGALLRGTFPQVLVAVVGWRIVCSLMLLAASSRAAPGLWREGALDRGVAKMYFQFGRWVTLYSVITPFNMNIDRIVLGVVVSAAASAYYAMPFDVLSRLSVVPAAWAMAIFPRLTAMGRAEPGNVGKICRLSLEFILLTVWPLLITVLLFGTDLLRLWVGNDFAAHSGTAAKILALGLMVGVVKPVFWSVVEGNGRPDLLAKLYLVEGVANVAVVYVLVRGLGVEGAAISFAVRALAETAIVAWMALGVAGLRKRDLWDSEMRRVLVVLGSLAIAAAGTWSLGAGITQVIALCAVFCAFLVAVWAWVWSEETKGTLLRALLPRTVGGR
jgi:O-antigen/teichoic acid export membrane protein